MSDASPSVHASLNERVAVVTGASSGIGWAIARDLVAAGMRVAVCARRRDRLEELQRQLGARGQSHLLPMTVDLRSEAAILAFFQAVKERWSGVDVLVNNAGLGHAAPLVSGVTQHWRDMLEVNILALCICTREAVADMQARAVAGHVVHVSSMAAHRVPRASGVYSATKYAVRSLTEGLRLELRELDSDIRVTSVSPGYVETGFAAHYHKSEEAAQKTYSRFPVLTSENVSAAVLYVLQQPPHVQIHDILMRPTRQPS